MKHTLLLTSLFFISSAVVAQSPKWMKKVRQSQVAVITYNDKGEMHEAQGIWVSNTGTVVTDYDVMKNAVRASVTDFSGKEWKVTTILGANSTYNVAIMATDAQKTTALEQDMTQPYNGEIVYILPNSHQQEKNVTCTRDTISKIEQFNSVYNFATLSKTPNERQVGCPVLTEEGKLIGLLQNAIKADGPGYIIDTRYPMEMKMTAMDAANKDLRSIFIRKALPDKEEDAMSFMYLCGTADTTMYLGMADDFISKFPSNTTGYVLKAEMLCDKGEYSEAQKVYDQALQNKDTKKDEIHYSISRVIYQAAIAGKEALPEWTLEKALKESEEAYAISPLPLYISMQGFILYAMKKYDEACQKYLALSNTNMRSAENFLYAAQCRQMAGDSIQTIIALQDSALACYSKPYPQAASGIIMMRAKNQITAGNLREAVAGYNEYEHLAGGQTLPATFYAERAELEVRCRMYTGALSDMERAANIDPKDVVLRTQLAAMYYRVNHMEEAEQAARKAIEIDPAFPDAHRILGVILRQTGKTAEATQSLQKAADLGDEMAKKMLEEK